MGRTKTATLALLVLLAVILGYLWQAGWLGHPPRPAPGPLEKVTVNIDYSGFNALLWIARDRGFDRDQGLQLHLETYQTGQEALAHLSPDGLCLACCTEFVLVRQILGGAAGLDCLGVVSSGDNNEVIARRDRGISRPEDLRGKTIGVPQSTSAEFSLARFLTLHYIGPGDVTVVDINPRDLAEALASGKVDAVQIWEPIVYDVLAKNQGNTVSWPAQGGQDLYWLLVGRDDTIRKNPAAVAKLLRALLQAADFVRQHPLEAQAVMARWLKVPMERVQSGKFPKRYEVFLDQGLLLAMEDEARWLIDNHRVPATRLPDFLDYFYPAPLAGVAPQAVRLVIPPKPSPGHPAPPGSGEARP